MINLHPQLLITTPGCTAAALYGPGPLRHLLGVLYQRLSAPQGCCTDRHGRAAGQALTLPTRNVVNVAVQH